MKNTLLILSMAIIAISCSKSEEQIPPTLSLSSDNEIVFTPLAVESENKIITVTTNQQSWSVTSNQSWCKVSKSGDTFMISAEPNTVSSPPVPAQITVSAGNALPVKIGVKQDGVSFAISPSATQAFNDEGGNLTVNISSNTSWTIMSDKSWAAIDTQSGSGNGTIIISIAPNTSTEADQATISFRAGVDITKLTINRDYKREKYAVGDLYPKNETPYGVVFSVTNGGRNGKIFSLVETWDVWSSENVRQYLQSQDGTINMATLKEKVKSLRNYDVFDRCNSWDKGGKKWYLPAVEELYGIYATWNGSSSEIADDNARNALNAKLLSAGGMIMSPYDRYWSSNEATFDKAWCVSLKNGKTNNGNTNHIEEKKYSVKYRFTTTF